mgnify:CR=1 FL=1
MKKNFESICAIYLAFVISFVISVSIFSFALSGAGDPLRHALGNAIQNANTDADRIALIQAASIAGVFSNTK